ncbi:bifunctional UDP-N-acetylglucosamine diphosphorylase/glucosamine-1-phosphate N-acetyltransferase GlmU [Gilvimarinus sp. DA14]|uniref:bifunctional UDP-N-acetylglucosamine diphosphorylase/glucosamine-1-phosphate N-acetyltransferase GlmU n=1 Tax=Gilvimarinus sp. DA14 TaxID=2956798 RepID=UPI0020B64226|nr:bifunctional UDP-N-acetylglucosamine diphosphorylase/glucosamine-1-phosphate N-acetyltransferase GlmU [Gilvimarinus sp. DA14]UTF59045.1 bifunctional UDP-N-acetylglucosamine diphosphorylase/glucosamine-1-phosphate N-acetyltransferase GlmU [Gilvimarinus sp. DA14]
MLDIVILAAGKGTRMRSSKPKVMQTIAGKPLLRHVVDTAQQLLTAGTSPTVVVGFAKEQVIAGFTSNEITTVEQREQLGTGHAVAQALPYLRDDAVALILYGDVPLIQKQTLESLVAQTDSNSLAVLTVNLPNPKGYGRMLRNSAGNIIAIVEEKDATQQQRTINEINTGIMAVPVHLLKKWLPELSCDNAQGEYYLTDIIAKAAAENIVVNSAQPEFVWEVEGVNDRRQQAALERAYQAYLADKFMSEGLALQDPARFDCRGSLSFDQDVEIDINVVIEGKVHLGDGVRLGPNCVIRNSTLAAGTVVEANSIIDGAQINESCTIGPYARLRPGSVLQKNAKVGNFVEVKKSVIGVGSKVNHLSYIGDCTMGDGVNVGAGTITCNYDGVNKFRTEIGDNSFIGSNSALVAPVVLAAGTTVGAGSTITRTTEIDDLAIARAKQRNISGWQRPTKK